MVVKYGVFEISVSSRTVAYPTSAAGIARRIFRVASIRSLGEESLVFGIVERILVSIADPKLGPDPPKER